MLEMLVKKIKENCVNINMDMVDKAYNLAFEAHKEQKRDSGEPYIIHPIEVATILAELGMDTSTIVAGLLHDVIEDTEYTYDDIKNLFGEEVANLVSGVTKITKMEYKSKEEQQADNFRKMLLAMADDIRVIIIKLADRLHNMRTLKYRKKEKQKKTAMETLDIYAPLAHRLGISKIKWELEDLSFRYLHEEEYYDLVKQVAEKRTEREIYIKKIIEEMYNKLEEAGIDSDIDGRPKHFFSIYKKMVTKNKSIEQIFDLTAIRVLVNTVKDCYEVLGIVHTIYKPIPGRFKDYIAMPKPNMYQSLHTTVFGIDGYLFEIQIRTYDMDEVAENGIASHWAYKEGSGPVKADILNKTEQKLQFFKSIIDLSKDKMSNEEFVNSVKDEVLNNSIYCFTPKGDVIELPVGSTPLDFAYKIHTRVGETTIGAIVNNNIVPLDYELKNNDIVKINTNKSSTPSKEWINIVKTTQARNKIKSFFTKNEREVYIERGKDSIEKELRKRKIPFSDFFTDENIKKICEDINAVDLDEIYLMAGNGRVAVNSIINIIDKTHEVLVPKNIKVTSNNTDADIIVTGIDKIKVNLANCCNPVYGDEIIGYITKGNGISVHRINCHNLDMLEDRTLEVRWGSNSNKRYLTTLVIYTNNKDNHMLDLMQSISMLNVSVDEIKTISRADNNLYEVSCYVTGLEQLNKIILTLNKNNFVDKVERVMR